MWPTLLTTTSLVGAGIQAGALLMFLYGVCPTLRALDVPSWMRLHVSLDRSIERYMPALNLVTGGSTVILLFLAQDDLARWLRGLALACNIGLALISELANVRLNKVIASRSQSGQTEAMAEVRARWITWHGRRTAVISVGFLAYVAALLVETA
ncbi:DUF1772 domain-containing protein [Microbispora sp. RL4-1S]|uniref:DUF1772 domain-containing protein n=1 Tax=Microbispora oryzae TaxID=2806554 RepID=A0A940WRG8_9ACTN|nr:DUF1772 domain-containing protein [Microbispora oryzae]MBP2708262.1 DUF1772 domain-containing protein [Microbispora oryzae]